MNKQIPDELSKLDDELVRVCEKFQRSENKLVLIVVKILYLLVYEMEDQATKNQNLQKIYSLLVLVFG
jgi:hypothetical protein